VYQTCNFIAGEGIPGAHKFWTRNEFEQCIVSITQPTLSNVNICRSFLTMANNILGFIKLDCEKLIGERLPNLLIERRYTTKQNALHDDHFLGKITRWENFDQEIWNCYMDLNEHFQKLEGHTIAVTKLGEDGGPVPLVGIRCGNEISVSGHWNEYCLRQVATVAQTLDSRSQTVLNLAAEFCSSQTAESSVSKCLSPKPARSRAKSGLHWH
jgi:hypothetical protein